MSSGNIINSITRRRRTVAQYRKNDKKCIKTITAVLHQLDNFADKIQFNGNCFTIILTLFIRIIVILILFIITLGVTLDCSWQNWVLTLSSEKLNYC